MIQEVGNQIYRMSIPLPDSPLRQVNSYFIRGEERDLLVDTGFYCRECYDALQEGLKELGSKAKRRYVLLTHLHSDHSGLAEEFVGEGCRIYISRTDLDGLFSFRKGVLRKGQNDLHQSEGFPPPLIEQLYGTGSEWLLQKDTDYGRYCLLQGGEIIDIGNRRFEAISTPGHTPAHLMYWDAQEQLMFTGDHILFDITPNITAWSNTEDSLGNYLESLKRVREFPVKTALPGHREPGAYRDRIDQLLLHHEKRIQETLHIVQETPGLSGYEIAGRMRWKIRSASWESFPLTQKWFAVGECIAHLDYLRLRGLITRTQSDGIWRYQA